MKNPSNEKALLNIGTKEQLEGSEYCFSLAYRLKDTKVKIKLALYDLVLCLLEWATPRYRPIVIVIDQFQWLREDDWDLTRRMCSHIREGVLQQVSVFISSQPMDNARYRPHFIPNHLVEEYQKLRLDYAKDNKLIPHAWGEQKTKAFIKTQFGSIRDVSPALVELVHRQCGGRPGFSKSFVELLKDHANDLLEFEEMREREERRLRLKSWIDNTPQPHMLRFPIPSEILGVTLRQLDVLSPEQSLCLKTCASLCVAEGYRSLRVRESVVRAVHPVEEFRAVAHLHSTMKVLCMMKFIHLDEDDNGGGGSVINFPLALPETRSNAGSGVGGTVSRWKERSFGGYRTSIFNHAGVGSTAIKHRRWDSTVSNQSNNTYTDYPTQDNESAMNSSDDDTEIQSRVNGSPRMLSDNDGTEGIPRKSIRRNETRYFVFKDRTLYWFADLDSDQKPRGHIVFGDNILQLKRNDEITITIKHTRKNGKKYVLQGMSKQEKGDIDEWFRLFLDATTRGNNTYRVTDPNVGTTTTSSAVNSPIIRSPDMSSSTPLHSTKVLPTSGVITAYGNTNGNPLYPASSLGVDHIINEEKSISGYERGEGNLIKTPEELALEEIKEQTMRQNQMDNNSTAGNNHRITQLMLDGNQTATTTPNTIESEIVSTEDFTYRFAYGFLRDIVYESMLHSQRAKIHKNAEEYFKVVGNEKLRERHRELGQVISGMNVENTSVIATGKNSRKKERKKDPRLHWAWLKPKHCPKKITFLF
ncbi:hypothetical protein RFI_23762 [Reticulomyxa filosa]|uniref:PH domain-containing protein n=1 Tax=Reticulomyxa filosa TaxID=46433 RepID=X6MHW8_RETFI|nr:hypothetical protein RFI_23762 [Reticulomyxa filosa]|eukprot:ETO13608.1 hypothetical protein RFI_23762 [Reticulomyxa filosa]